MMGIVISLLLLGLAVPYFILHSSSRLLFIYPLIAYLMLWPKLFDQMGMIQATGDFGSIQIGDAFYLLFIVLLAFRVFSSDVIKVVGMHWLPLAAIGAYFSYWLLQLFMLSQEESARAALNQFRYLAYYLFLLFFLLRIREEEDVKNVLKVSCSFATPAAILTIIYIILFSAGYIKPWIMHIPGAYQFYKEMGMDMRFEVVNLKCYVMLVPFLLNIVMFRNLFGKWARPWQLISLCSIVFLLLVDQSRAFLLTQAVGFFLGFILLNLKGVVKFNRLLMIIPISAMLVVAVLVLLMVGDTFLPGLTDKLTGRLSSMTVSNVQDYKKNKEMGSLNSRVESYKYLISRVGNDYLFGKGVGTHIRKFGDAFRRAVDSTFLMNLWSGGLVALFLLGTFLLITLWQSWTGYLMAKDPFDIYFFTSSTVSLAATYVIAIQDNILFFGNSVVMFLLLASLVFAQKQACKQRMQEKSPLYPAGSPALMASGDK
jgi:hypothetical protein